MFQGVKVPGSKSSTYITFAPGSESKWERKFHNSLLSNDIALALILTLNQTWGKQKRRKVAEMKNAKTVTAKD